MPVYKNDTVVGLFRDSARAERAVRDLKDAGFTDNEIGVLMQDRTEQRKFAEDTGTKAGEGAAAGAATGGLLGGVFGLLAGVGALVIPGIGPIVAGGVLASTLAGAGIGAAAGGLAGALIGMGIPEEEAHYYERGFREGGILVTVDAGARRAEARHILRNAGADFGPAAEGYSRIEGEDRERIELREEELRASKERVKAGEVRVRKEVVTDKKTIDVPVTREEVVVERHPVSGRPASGHIGKNEEIRVPLTEEKVRVEKTPVVKEEITLGKREVQDTQRVQDTVRREEARIEESGQGRVREPWRGKERRRRRDPSYAGPDRRTATV
jgi:uncharacterized protein (TIGR02271 family)